MISPRYRVASYLNWIKIICIKTKDHRPCLWFFYVCTEYSNSFLLARWLSPSQLYLRRTPVLYNIEQRRNKAIMLLLQQPSVHRYFYFTNAFFPTFDKFLLQPFINFYYRCLFSTIHCPLPLAATMPDLTTKPRLFPGWTSRAGRWMILAPMPQIL